MYLVGLVCIINIHTLMIQTKLRCGGVVNNLISNALLLHVSLPLKKITQMIIWQSYKQQVSCLLHSVVARCTQSAQDNHLLAYTYIRDF